AAPARPANRLLPSRAPCARRGALAGGELSAAALPRWLFAASVALALIARAPSPLLRSVPLAPALEASVAPLQVPPETPPAALLGVTQVMIAAEQRGDPLYALIADDLAAAVAATGAARPPVVDGRAPSTAGTVRVGGRPASRPGRALPQDGTPA